MPWPVHPNGLLGAQGDSDSYRIERSLRFNSADDAYLNRTPASAGNRKTWTWSGWVKKCKNEAFQQIFSNLTAANSNGFIFRFDNDDTLAFGNFTSAYTAARETNRVFRDNSSWYHIVATWDTTNATASDRIKIYINGIEETSFKTTTNPSLNADGFINNTNLHAIGRAGSVAGSYFDGYLAEINFIDGQALTPSSFGETDAITGRWKAKAYSGTYGTNGFYLKFADNSGTTATTLGKDSSGNGNNWTPNNFSVTAGAGNDSLVDSPTNYGTDTGLGGEVRGNYATLNPLTGNSPLVDGNLRPTANTAISTIGMSSKKWYAEMNVVIEGTIAEFGIHTGKTFNTYVGTTVDGYGYSSSGDKRTNNVGSAYGASYTSGDIIGCAFDADAGTLVFYKNNVSQGTAFTGLTNGPYFFAAYGRSVSAANNVYVNFGQRPFAYTAPSGFKALCTTNLPTPVIKKPSSAMDVVTYTGTGASQSISSLGFSPDLVWMKGRSGATGHAIYDSVRGVQKDIDSSVTTDETNQTQGLTSFDSNGFTIGTLAKINTSSATYVAWVWDKGATKGLDIVTYTGNGANRTISHGLNATPRMIIVKALTTASTDQGWPVYHASVAVDPETDYFRLDTAGAVTDLNTVWNDTAPTSSVFSVGASALVNTNNDTYIAYLFSEVDGFSKFGSYTGNGSADGPFVWCGFRPKWIMTHRTLGASNIAAYDSARSGFNIVGDSLLLNSNVAESASGACDFLANGFKIRATATLNNSTGVLYVFAAFAESPFKYARAR